MEILEIATRFVDLTLRYDLKTNQILPADEIQVLFDTVAAAGFDPSKVIFKSLVRFLRDGDGDLTGETYQVNSLCPFSVVNQKDKDDNRATSWLNALFAHVIHPMTYPLVSKVISRAELIHEVITEIERSIPLTPIQLTPEGDQLAEYPPVTHNCFVDHTRDHDQLSSSVGVHRHCQGFMDMMPVTETYSIILCRRCYLRVPFPNGVTTYGDLRKWLFVSIMFIED